MRICFISVGTFLHVGPYIEYFRQAGHDVHFIALTPSPPRSVPIYNVGIGKKYSATEGKWKYPFSMPRARRLVKKLKPDIVHTHYATSGGLTGLVCGFHPTVVTVHGSDLTVGIKSRIWRVLLKAIFNQADCVNTASEDLKNMVLSLGICPEKIRVLTLGIDTERFSFISPPRRTIDKSRPLRLVCTRRLEPVYDPRTVVEALVVLKGKGVKFRMTFVGDGTLRGELESLVEHYQLGQAVTFLGTVDNKKLPAVLHEHDVYLSASLWDGTSLSLLEAMATGLFPIVSDIRANSTWLEHGISGFLHRVGKPDDLAGCIVRLLDRPELAGSAAKLNRDKVVKSGDRKTNMRELEKIYHELTTKGRRQ